MIDYYKLLNLSPTADFATIKESCKALRAKYESEMVAGINIATLQSQLDIVIEAQICLLDPDSREAYNEDLASAPPSKIRDPLAPKHFDFESIRASDLDSWTTLVDFEDTVTIDTYRSLLERSVKLPHAEIQTDILLAAMLTPSALATSIPCVLSHGLPGCGKSQISNLVSKVWGTTPTLGNATFATLRRIVGAQSSTVDAGKKYFINNALCWDDISPEHLANPDKASLLKSSTTRATSVYKMPKRDTDDEFTEIETFGLRFFSSIYPFFADPMFIEMKRRMLVIQCKKSQEASSVLDFESIDWTGLDHATRMYWEIDNGANSRRYSFLRKGVVTSVKKASLSPERGTLCTDLLTTGLTFGIWKSNDTAIKALSAFYALNDELSDTRQSALKSLLITVTAGKQELMATEIKSLVDSGLKQGLIDSRIRKGELTTEMRLLGWELNVDDRLWRRSA